MKKQFVIQHIWLNNQDAAVTLAGLMKEDVLTYESKLVIRMARLNAVISEIQKQAGIEVSEYMCRFELGFITEYEISFPQAVQVELDLEAILGLDQQLVKRIVA